MTSWTALAGELVPLALVVALSPFSVIPPLLLVLHSARPRATGLAFGAGWLLGLGASTAVFVLLPRALGGTGTEQGAVGAYARIGLGAVLVLAGVVRWFTRRRATRDPAWLTGLARIGPVVAFGLGVVLPVLNPKFLFANAAAGFAIGTAGVSTFGGAWAVVGYTLLAASTTVLPVLVCTPRLPPATTVPWPAPSSGSTAGTPSSLRWSWSS